MNRFLLSPQRRRPVAHLLVSMQHHNTYVLLRDHAGAHFRPRKASVLYYSQLHVLQAAVEYHVLCTGIEPRRGVRAQAAQ
jgi:hypothetical protein